VVKGDPIEKYILISNSHDGTLAIRVGYTPIRVVCANTLSMALGTRGGTSTGFGGREGAGAGMKNLIRIFHRGDPAKNVMAVAETMDVVNRQFTATVEVFKDLAAAPISHEDLEKYVKVVFRVSQKDEEDMTDEEKVASRIVTGIAPVDKMLGGGVKRGHMTLVAARPGMGKTSYLVQMAEGASRLGYEVKYFSLEETTVDITSRLVGGVGRVDMLKVEQSEASRDELARVIEAQQEIHARASLRIDDASATTTVDIRASMERARLAGRPVDLVIVDHLQLLGDEPLRGEGIVQYLGRVSWALKRIAKDFRAVVACGMQLSRAAAHERRAPVLTDLRESGRLEENADVVLGLHRPAYYEPQDQQTDQSAEIWTLKNRHGPANTKATMVWIGAFRWFARMDPQPAAGKNGNGYKERVYRG